MPNKPTVEELLARVEQDPDDVELRNVLVDALAEAGDPRGELGAVQGALATLDAQFEGLVTQHAKSLYTRDEDGIYVTKDSGFVDTITISLDENAYKSKRTANAFLEKMLAKRSARMTTTFALRLSDKKPTKPVKDMLACLATIAERAPAVRTLDLYVFATNGDMAIDVVPALSKLKITKLLLSGSMALVKNVFSGTWPNITSLGLAPYDEELTNAETKRLRECKAFPNLVELALALPEAVMPKIFESPLAAQLRVLDLSHVAIEDAPAKKLIAARAKLGKLEKLAIDPRNMDTKTIRGLRDLCRDVTGLPDEAQLAWAEAEMSRLQHDHDHYEEIEE